MSRLKITLIVGGMCYFLVSNVAIVKLNESMDKKESDFEDYKHVSDSLHTYKDDRLKNYYQVTRIQDSIIEENTFTKRLKKNHKKLLDCSSKL